MITSDDMRTLGVIILLLAAVSVEKWRSKRIASRGGLFSGPGKFGERMYGIFIRIGIGALVLWVLAMVGKLLGKLV